MTSKSVQLRVPFSYLDRQFADLEPYLKDIEALAKTGVFTLGEPVGVFEEKFAAASNMPYAIGLSSGTDALILAMQAAGIGPGDEVISTPFTFIATVASIAMVGAKPVLVDSDEEYTLDPSKIEAVITKKTKAILPVHYTGRPADMKRIVAIAKRHNLKIIEDGCQAVQATRDGQPVGSWSEAAAISFHPLKNFNVWGDGGAILTPNKAFAERVKLLRNHGLLTRDKVTVFSRNARLHSLQAVIGTRLLEKLDGITQRRIELAAVYDRAFADLKGSLDHPKREPSIKEVYHLYILRAKNRDGLLQYLHAEGVDAKIHYPIPVHLQEGARYLGYKEGDFPFAEADCKRIISLPLHQHLADEEQAYTIDCVRAFYKK